MPFFFLNELFHIQQRAQLAEKLDAELKELNAKYQALQEELEREKANLAEQKEKDAYLEEKVNVLKGLLEQENEEKDELTKELNALKALLEEEQKKNVNIISKCTKQTKKNQKIILSAILILFFEKNASEKFGGPSERIASERSRSHNQSNRFGDQIDWT